MVDNIKPIINTGLEYINENPNKPYYKKVVDYSGCNDSFNTDLNHFILFLKPESLDIKNPMAVSTILDILYELKGQYAVNFGGISLISGAYLRKHKIIDKHYGVLNRISREGKKNCSNISLDRANVAFKLSNTDIIYGGHQLLDEVKSLTPFSLCKLIDNIGSTKLGSGTYAVKANIDGKDIIILNGFHPYQLECLTGFGSSILAIECWSKTPWNIIRREMIGYIDPSKAEDGSFRKRLFENKSKLQLKEISVAFNYIHISPGPLESMYQIVRFFSNYENGSYVPYDFTNFGYISSKSINNGFLSSLESNPEFLVDNINIPIFDATEDMDTNQCFSLVTNLFNR